MANFLDATYDPVKIMLIGENGTGKSGALASLVCMGQKLRIIDTDKGVKALRSLLTDPRYPYARYIAEKKIDLRTAVDYVSIDIPMAMRRIIEKDNNNKITRDETVLAPLNANGWTVVSNLLYEWKYGSGDKAVSYGKSIEWGNDTTIVIDTLSTLAQMAYYYIQQLNGRLGAREDGFDFQRDVGAAQAQLRRLMEMLSSSGIKCNVVLISHITRVDLQAGFGQSPEQRARDNKVVDAKGYPATIGRALSTNIGKFTNDIYQVTQSGSGTSVTRSISTVSVDKVAAKNSVYLDASYPVSTGLAEIFAAHRGEPNPTELIAAIRGPKPTVPTASIQKAG